MKEHFTTKLTLAILLYFFTSLSVFASRSNEQQIIISEKESTQQPGPVRGERPPIDIRSLPVDAYEQGVIQVRFAREMETLFEGKSHFYAPAGEAVKLNHPEIDLLNNAYGVKGYEPLLGGLYDKSPESEMHRKQHQEWGFHLWFRVVLDTRSDIVAAIESFAALPEVLVAEPVYKKRLIESTPVEQRKMTPGIAHDTQSRWTPNDPQYNTQWHYHNTGQNIWGQNGIAGIDINLQPAWDIEKGNPDVIVAIVDNGVHFAHPDLQANMWPGIGPEGNNTTPAGHGTHVAGTIAAVTNNNIGVSGIAGGSGSGNGVRLMSVDLLDGNHGLSDLALYVYQANNGAAISQNSWGYINPNVYNQSALDGIDYFNSNGGGEALTGGGITIFAAGNDNDNAHWYPAYYSGAMAVASFDNRGIRSSFSNYGTWIDISAPGTGINSTYYPAQYDYLQGTSMACPHVSGVAALIISNVFGSLTPTQLWNILISTADDINTLNPTYNGLLGAGRVNAHAAILAAQAITGENPYCPENTLSSNSPDGNHALTSSTDQGTINYFLFDDTMLDEATLVEGFVLWGLQAFNDGAWTQCLSDNMDFAVKFYENDNGEPGTIIHEEVVVVTTEIDTDVVFGTWTVKQFLVNLSESVAFHQGFVSLASTNSPECWFLGINAEDGLANSYIYNANGEFVQRMVTPEGEDSYATGISYCLFGSVPAPSDVTFRVNMGPAILEGFDPAIHKVFVTGDFIGWAEPGTEGSVELTLESPVDNTFYEDFSDFADFTTDLSPWINIDNHANPTWGSNAFDFEGEGTAFGWRVMNPAATTPDITGNNPAYAGSNYLFSVASNPIPDTGEENKWLISPAMDVTAESELSFAAKSITDQYGMERMKVYVSTTGTTPEDFTLISEGNYIEVPTVWTEYSFSLADFAGQTIHFAIENVSNDAFMLFLDAFSVTNLDADESQPNDLFYTAAVEIPNGNILYKYFSDAFGEGWDGGEWMGEPNREALIDESITLSDIWAVNENDNYYQLALFIDPIESGNVTGAGSYQHGESASISAVPANGFQFVNWTNTQGNIVSQQANFTLIMPDYDISLTANFELTDYTVTAAVAPEGAGTVTGHGTYNMGDMVSLTTTANTGYEFISWTNENEVEVSNDLTFVFVMPANNVSLTANYVKNTYTLNYTTGENGTIEGNLNQIVEHGENGEAVTAIANANYNFIQWSDGITDNPRTDTNVSENISVAAQFSINTHVLDISIMGQGQVKVNGANYTQPMEFDYGTNLTLEALPANGWQFENWTGDNSSTQTIINLVIEDDMDIVANFELIDYTVTLAVAPEDAGTLTGHGTYNMGDMVSLTASANTGYEFISWTNENEVEVSNNLTYDFEMPANNVSLTANYVKTTHVLDISIMGQGQVKVNGANYTQPMEFDYGTNLTLEALPANGWQFENWTGDNSSTQTIINLVIEDDMDIVANFSLIPVYYTLILNTEPVNSASLSGGGNYTEDTQVEINAAPNTGYLFSHWKDQFGNSLSNASSWIFTMPAQNSTLTAVMVSDDATALDEPNKSQVIVYPNPARDKVYFTSIHPIDQIRIYNTSGQVVMKEYPAGETQFSIDVAHLLNGMYIVELQSAHFHQQIKLLVK